MPNDNTHTGKQYAERDVLALDEAGGYYFRHVSAMTSERLRAKSDIAAELAWRDAEIDRLKDALSRTPAEPKAGDWDGWIMRHLITTHELIEQFQANGKTGEFVDADDLRRALSSAAIATTNEVSTNDRLVDAPRITEEMVERLPRGFIDAGNGYSRFDDELVFRKDVIALLRQQGAERSEHPQGPQRSEDQQGAERKWISVDDLRHTEARLLILELLRRQGYAKGGYVNTCKVCGKDAWWMDKLAWTCLECAQHNVNDLLYSITNDPSEPPPFTPTQTEE